jgi:hypothetical protein
MARGGADVKSGPTSEVPASGRRSQGDQLKNFTMRRIEVTRASMSDGVLYT